MKFTYSKNREKDRKKERKRKREKLINISVGGQREINIKGRKDDKFKRERRE